MKGLPPRFTNSDKLRDFPNEIAAKIISQYSPADSEINKIEFRPEEILVSRKDGAIETMKNDSIFWKEWVEKKKTLEEKYLAPNSMAKVVSFIYTDGLRITTENGEVVHLRESSNAPELRCYAVASSLDRAQELVHIVLTRMVHELRADLA